MDASSGRPQMKTLGKCLLSLRPGDPCPCCGARLQVVKSTQAVRSAAVVGGGLVCRECGCELAEVASPFEQCTKRALSPAA